MKKFTIYVDGEHFDVNRNEDAPFLFSVTSAYGTAYLGYNSTEKRWKLNSDLRSNINFDVDKVGKAIKEQLSIEG